MVEAFILIQTEIGKPVPVATQVGELHRVVSAVVVTGPYDVIAHVTADDVDSLGKMVGGCPRVRGS